MTDISIVYCKPCGYEGRASDAAAELRRAIGVTAKLVPGKGGIFEVQVGSKVVAQRAKGHFPDAAEIVAAVSAALTTADRTISSTDRDRKSTTACLWRDGG